MKANPILEELWKVKDDLAREAGHDPFRFFANLRKWAAEHPHPGPAAHSAEDLQKLAAAMENERTAKPAMILNDKPLPKP